MQLACKDATLLSFRVAEPADVAAIVKVENAAFDPAKFPVTTPRQYRYLLSKTNDDILLAIENGAICGIAVIFYRKNSRFARLYALAVLPEAQAKGIGGALFRYAENRAKERDKIGMTCEIRADNFIFRYADYGYKPTEIVAGYFPDGCNAVKLKKVFTSAAPN